MTLLLALPLLILAGYVVGWLCYIRGNVAGYREGFELQVEHTKAREDLH